MRRKCHKTKDSQGFAILVVPFVLALVGFFLVLTLRQGETQAFYGELHTQKKMERVREAVATYAHRNFRVPCPSVANSSDAAFGAEIADCENANVHEGIIPFRTLGLSEFDIKDSWGNYFTYAVSPGFTRVRNYTSAADGASDDEIDVVQIAPTNFDVVPSDKDRLYTAPDNDPKYIKSFVEQWCRQTGTWVDENKTNYNGPKGDTHVFRTNAVTGNPTALSVQRNIFKAQFCCSNFRTVSATPSTPSEAKTDTVSFIDMKDEINKDRPKQLTMDFDGDGKTDALLKAVSSADNSVYDSRFIVPELSWTESTGLGMTTAKSNPNGVKLNTPDEVKSGKCGTGKATSKGLDGDDVAVFYNGKPSDTNRCISLDGVNYGTTKMNETIEMKFPGENTSKFSMSVNDIDDGSFKDGNVPSFTFDAEIVDNDGNSLGNVEYTIEITETPADEIANLSLDLQDDTSVSGSFGEALKNKFGSDYAENGLNFKSIDFSFSKGVSFMIETMSLSVPGEEDEGDEGEVVASDISITNEKGDALIQPRDAAAAQYLPANVAAPVTPGLQAQEGPAFVLISHGSNGLGAYNVTDGSKFSSSSASALELRNIQADQDDPALNGRYVAARRNLTNGNNYFDDIVMFDSQLHFTLRWAMGHATRLFHKHVNFN